MNLKYYTSIALLLLLVGSLHAQRRTSTVVVDPNLEELPRRAIDTIPTADEDTKIIIYSNNTWSYYRPGLDGKYGDLPVYNEYWDSENLFAYRSVQLSDIPEVVDINLISSLNDFHPPIVGRVFSKYGPRGRRNHNGVDIPLKTGEPIYATFEGKVRLSKWNSGGYGNLVIIRHKNGLETWHAHLSKRNVEAGEYVKPGQIIGFGGNTGRSRGAHLHYEVRYKDQTFDPEHLIDFENGRIKYQTFALERSYFNIHSRASDQLEEHDFDEYAALVNSEGNNVTSEDILNRIAKSQTNEKPATASVSSSSSSGAVYHTIKSGDMLGKLAVRYGVSIDQICRLNNINRNTILKLGRRLRIK